MWNTMFITNGIDQASFIVFIKFSISVCIDVTNDSTQSGRWVVPSGALFGSLWKYTYWNCDNKFISFCRRLLMSSSVEGTESCKSAFMWTVVLGAIIQSRRDDVNADSNAFDITSPCDISCIHKSSILSCCSVTCLRRASFSFWITPHA